MQEENNNFIIEDEPIYGINDIERKINEVITKLGYDKKRAIQYLINNKLIPDITNPEIRNEGGISQEDYEKLITDI